MGLVHEELTGEIIAAAIDVHKILGPGFLESVYENALAIELEARGLGFQRQAWYRSRIAARRLGCIAWISWWLG